MLGLVCLFYNPSRFAPCTQPLYHFYQYRVRKCNLLKTMGIGSAAAAIQSGAGNVAAGGAFATV